VEEEIVQPGFLIDAVPLLDLYVKLRLLVSFGHRDLFGIGAQAGEDGSQILIGDDAGSAQM
jgi:hypothetical protein